MKRDVCTSIIATATLALSLGHTGSALASEWTLDPDHSRIGFAVRYMMVSNVEGNFGVFEGVVQLDEEDVAKSKVNVVIDVASIDTDNKKRDDHLRKEDFFHVDKYPKITFESKKVSRKAKGLEVAGELTLRGITKPIVLQVDELTGPVKGPWGDNHRGVVARTKINRSDFGLTWNKAIEAGGVVVGEEVQISLKLDLIEKGDKEA